MIDQGSVATISLMQCVTSAKLQLKIEVSDDDIFLERLANEAVRHLDALSTFRKHTVLLEVEENRVKLPPGYQSLIGIRMGTGQNTGTAIYVDMPFLTSIGVSPDLFNTTNN